MLKLRIALGWVRIEQHQHPWTYEGQLIDIGQKISGQEKRLLLTLYRHPLSLLILGLLRLPANQRHRRNVHKKIQTQLHPIIRPIALLHSIIGQEAPKAPSPFIKLAILLSLAVTTLQVILQLKILFIQAIRNEQAIPLDRELESHLYAEVF